MNLIPKKAVVFYCPIKPNGAIPNIDKISLAGCSGQIALEQKGGTRETSNRKEEEPTLIISL